MNPIKYIKNNIEEFLGCIIFVYIVLFMLFKWAMAYGVN